MELNINIINYFYDIYTDPIYNIYETILLSSPNTKLCCVQKYLGYLG